MKFISYYTPDYRPYAKGLRDSLDRLGLDHCIEERPSQGDWRKNCQYKAIYIQEKLVEPVVWVDIDAVVKRRPDLLIDCRADFAARFKESGRLMSGTLFFNTTSKARALLSRWIKAQEITNAWDQKVLQGVLDDNLSILELPLVYCQKYDEKQEGTVIKHFMASRTLRHGR